MTTLAMLATACGDDGSGPPEARPFGDLESGYLVADGSTVRLCPALAESFPPQCSGDAIEVRGLEVGEVLDTSTEGTTTWTDRPISLRGDRDGRALSVPPAVEGPAIVGRALAGPVCPVESSPPDPACADRSVEGAVLVIRSLDTDSTVATIVTDATGRFGVRVAPGSYSVEPQPVVGLLGTAPAQPVAVDDMPRALAVRYDTGIR